MNSNSIETRFNIASVKLCTEALGPFKRMSIWFQGCTFNCKGCCNPELQPLAIRNIIGLEDLVNLALESKRTYSIEGVTFIGGEPTLQSGLDVLAHRMHEIGLGTILFTGRSFDELDEYLKSGMDIVIDGRFHVDDMDTTRNLIGSNNQRIIEVTDRYHDNLDWFTVTRPDFVEVDVDGGYFLTNGSSF